MDWIEDTISVCKHYLIVVTPDLYNLYHSRLKKKGRQRHSRYLLEPLCVYALQFLRQLHFDEPRCRSIHLVDYDIKLIAKLKRLHPMFHGSHPVIIPTILDEHGENVSFDNIQSVQNLITKLAKTRTTPPQEKYSVQADKQTLEENECNIKLLDNINANTRRTNYPNRVHLERIAEVTDEEIETENEISQFQNPNPSQYFDKCQSSGGTEDISDLNLPYLSVMQLPENDRNSHNTNRLLGSEYHSHERVSTENDSRTCDANLQQMSAASSACYDGSLPCTSSMHEALESIKESKKQGTTTLNENSQSKRSNNFQPFGNIRSLNLPDLSILNSQSNSSKVRDDCLLDIENYNPYGMNVTNDDQTYEISSQRISDASSISVDGMPSTPSSQHTVSRYFNSFVPQGTYNYFGLNNRVTKDLYSETSNSCRAISELSTHCTALHGSSMSTERKSQTDLQPAQEFPEDSGYVTRPDGKLGDTMNDEALASAFLSMNNVF